MAETLRFQTLVDRSGRPDVYTPWADPLKDRKFQKARKENRVLTIHQNLHGAKDYGAVGFQEGRGLQFLIFPKSLRWAEGKRIIGIRYEDIAEAKFPVVPVAAKSKKEKLEATHRKITPQSPESPARAEEQESSKESARPPVEEKNRDEQANVDPLTAQLKTILRALETSHVPKAKSVLKNLIKERERAASPA